jgi:putative FmdB family regulatory protein
MPIYEFKCSKCEHFFEVIIMGSQKDETVVCPECQSAEYERVVSTANFAMGGSAGRTAAAGVTTQERNCSSGSCTTYTVPGETRS